MRGRRFSFAMPGLVVLLLSSGNLLSSPAYSEPPGTRDLSGSWRVQAGDGPRWAEPDFSDRDWPSVRLPATWNELGFGDDEPTVWFRRSVIVGDTWLRSLAPSGPAILIGAARYGHFELYVDGRFVGTSEDLGGLAAPRSTIFALPPEISTVPLRDDASEEKAVTGPLVVALRFERLEGTNARTGETRPFGAEILLGDSETLHARAELERLRRLHEAVPAAGLTFFFFLVGLYHLELFRHRRESSEYLWFGLLSFSFAAVNYLVSPWAWEHLGSWHAIERLSSAGKHLAMALQIQFLWILANRPIGGLLRTYQISHLAFTAAALVAPTSWTLLSYDARAAYSLAFFPVMGVVFAGVVRGGRSEKRLVAVTGVVLAVAVVVYLGLQLLDRPVAPPLPAWAFALFVLAMAVTLANRFSRVHRELDALNRKLEERVEERTSELREKSRNLTWKNREILRAQEKLVRSEKLASVAQLIAGIVHEIKNPMQAISEALPRLRGDVDKMVDSVAAKDRGKAFDEARGDLEERLAVIEEGTARATEIVQDLRTFIRPSEVTPRVTDIHEALDSTLTLLRNRFQDRIRVVKNYGELPRVECYSNQLKQVFMNVLVNAIQAIDGEGTITLTTRQEAGGRVSISIRDTGRGMSELVRRKVFDPFFTTKPRNENAGLGLSISHGIVDEHGGTIGVRSVQGHGTEIIVTLPSRIAGHARVVAKTASGSDYEPVS